MEKENILGFNVCNTNYNDLIKNIYNDFNHDIRNFIVSINPEIITKNYKNKELRNIFNSQKYQIPDGIGIIYASKLQKGNIINRITGIDLMNLICQNSVNYNSRIFLYGAKEGISQKAKKELEILYPNINIVGTCSGYENENTVIDKINNSNANILFVGLGSPNQENFIINNMDKLNNVKIFMPVGGSLDVISKSLKRAPNWVIKSNLEWLFRVFKQPKRIFRQFSLLKFIFLILFRRKKYEKIL